MIVGCVCVFSQLSTIELYSSPTREHYTKDFQTHIAATYDHSLTRWGLLDCRTTCVFHVICQELWTLDHAWFCVDVFERMLLTFRQNVQPCRVGFSACPFGIHTSPRCFCLTWRANMENRAWKKVLSKKLRNGDLLDVEQFVYSTRPMTGGLFTVLWKALLDYLRLQNDTDAVDTLLTYYLSSDARDSRHFGVVHMTGWYPAKGQGLKLKKAVMVIGEVSCLAWATGVTKPWLGAGRTKLRKRLTPRWAVQNPEGMASVKLIYHEIVTQSWPIPIESFSWTLFHSWYRIFLKLIFSFG